MRSCGGTSFASSPACFFSTVCQRRTSRLVRVQRGVHSFATLDGPRQRTSREPLTCCAAEKSASQHDVVCRAREQPVASDAEVPPEASSSGRVAWDLPSRALGNTSTRLFGFAGVLAAIGGGPGLLGSGFDTSGPGSVVSALGVLAAIITIHECGHFIAARAQNIHVTKFSIGFGPALWSYKGKKVEYSLRAIPLGGFVAFPDDDPESEFKPDDPDLLRNRSIRERFLVISAGIIANCLFAYSILFVQASTVGMASATLLPGVKVPKVVPGSVAEAAGIRKGDIIVGLNDQTLSNSRENVNRLVQYIKDHPEKRIVFKVARKDGVVSVPVVSELDADGDGKIGVQLATYAKVTRKPADGPLDAATRAAKEFGRMTSLVGNGLLQIFTNFQQSKQAVSGPLAIVAAGAEVARNDAASLFQFAAIVNINLAIVNALPLPALDGGYMLLLLVEAIRGKKLDKIVEQTFMASGFLLLTGLGVFLVIRDALSLGQSLL